MVIISVILFVLVVWFFYKASVNKRETSTAIDLHFTLNVLYNALTTMYFNTNCPKAFANQVNEEILKINLKFMILVEESDDVKNPWALVPEYIAEHIKTYADPRLVTLLDKMSTNEDFSEATNA